MKKYSSLLLLVMFMPLNQSCKHRDILKNWTCTFLAIDQYNTANVPTDTTKTVMHFNNLTAAQANVQCKQGSDTVYSQNAITINQTILTAI